MLKLDAKLKSDVLSWERLLKNPGNVVPVRSHCVCLYFKKGNIYFTSMGGNNWPV